MKRLSLYLVAALAAASLLVAACTQAAPPAPTSAPAKPAEATKAPAAPTAAPAAPAATKAPEATKPAAQPTAAPAAKKIEWPEKGKTITLLQPSAAGGPNDIWARLLGSYMEKELGVAINVVPRPGASGQIGMTEAAKAKPDGYTLVANSLEQTIYTYLDKDRQAPYDRKSFQSIALGLFEPFGLVVPGNSPYKTAKDVIDAAKANPEKIKVGDNGIGSPSNMAPILLSKLAGVKFAHVHFNGSGEQVAALMGGHIDAGSILPSGGASQLKTGDLRPLAVFGDQEVENFPNTRTARSLGWDVVMPRSLGLAGPAGLPMEIVQILGAAMKKVDTNPEYLQKAKEAAMLIRHMELAEYEKYWDDTEKRVASLMGDIKADEARQPTPTPAPAKK